VGSVLVVWLYIFFFFFSSRRRHTRFKCDWSSDVCSSDLRVARLPSAREDVGVDAVGCVALHRPGAALAEERRGARKQQLQVIVRSEERRVGKEWKWRRS